MSALFLMALLSSPASPAEDELAQKAEEAFERGLARRERNEKSRALFLESARDFEELRQRGVRNALLERNLGNAYLLAGDLPRAILAYRRGLRLAPADRALKRNLEHARRKVIYLEGSSVGRPPETLRPGWLPHAPRALFALAVLAYVGLWLCLTRWFMVRRSRWLLLALVAALAATLMLVVSTPTESDRPIVVIAAHGVLLRKGNGTTFPPRLDTPLNRGVEASLLYLREGWLQIELAGGEVGWVPASDAVVDADSSHLSTIRSTPRSRRSSDGS